MANPEHLAILKQGVEEWNKWRLEHPEVRPDLSEADLTFTRLHDPNLRDADFHGVTLTDASLLGAAWTSAFLKLLAIF